MLNFRVTSVLFVFLLGLLLIGTYIGLISIIYAIIAALIYSGILAWGASVVSSGFYIKTICRGVTGDKTISLTFDDGPEPGNTNKILDILGEHNTKATFFLIGNKIDANKEIVKNIDDQGHLIGNHTHSHHFFFDLKSKKKMVEELNQFDSTVQNAIQKTPRFFRPPYGVTNPNLAKAIKEKKLTPVGWSVRSLDTVIKDVESLKKRVSKIAAGDIILFHDTSNSTVELLPGFLTMVKEKGFKIVGLDELIKMKAYE